MNNIGENVNSYNTLLIKYLNDLVNDIERDTELKKRNFVDIVDRLHEKLDGYGMNFRDDIIMVILSQAFKEYANILRKYFDGSNIHRIDMNLDDKEKIIQEMDQVTGNLINAVNNMDNFDAYHQLIKKIRDSIIYQLKQNFNNFEAIQNEVDNILNEIILTSITTITVRKKEDFNNDVLPQFDYLVNNTINSINIDKMNDNPSINVNEERDNFINETMDIEIHEGFEDGVVTLTVIDQMGEKKKYYGEEAMEKLTSYNQLFESSRPGKKADTSRWPKVSKQETTDEQKETLPPIEQSAMENIVPIDEQPFNETTTDNGDEIDNFVSKYNNEKKEVDSSDELLSPITPLQLDDDFNNLTLTTRKNELFEPMSTMDDTNVQNENDVSIPPNEDFNNLTSFDQNTNPDERISFSNDTDENNNTMGNEISNDINFENKDSNDETSSTNDDGMTKLREMFNINSNDETSSANSSSFLKQYNNPNSERDEFIKNSTGFTIEEDKDNRNQLFLRVVEPSGREVIYTGKEAVDMIKNYNRAYLDANPKGKVDTTLIDNYKDN